jgi:hypothetical protein
MTDMVTASPKYTPAQMERIPLYTILVAALSASAGWGVFILYALGLAGRPPMAGVRGLTTALVIAYFLVSIPAALGTVGFRDTLLSLPTRRLRVLAWICVAATVLAFGYWYVANMTIAREGALMNE